MLPSNGQEPSFTRWGARQPDNFAGHEDCAVMLSITGAWEDNSCTSVHPFVCERKWRYSVLFDICSSLVVRGGSLLLLM